MQIAPWNGLREEMNGQEIINMCSIYCSTTRGRIKQGKNDAFCIVIEIEVKLEDDARETSLIIN